jgi:hypothetical protein
MNLPEAIRQALKKYRGGFANIDQLLAFVRPELAQEAIDGHLDTLLKVEIRHAVKSLRDEDGEPVWENVTGKAKGGKEEKRYKQLALFNFEDFVECASSYASRAHGQMRRANELAKLCKKRTGRQIPLPFPDFDAIAG